MKWNKYTLKTRSAVVDIISAALAEVGVGGVEIEDAQPLTKEEQEQMFVDIMLPVQFDDGIAKVSFYIDVDEDNEAILTAVYKQLDELKDFVDIGEGSIAKSQTKDEDWINNWKEHFKQFYVDDILIIPSWEKVKDEDQDKMIINIDPGTAFGTGMHETTQLCIRQLKKYVTSTTKILDVGTGSGILAIIALKMGAKLAVGTDLDPCAKRAVVENKKANEIPIDSFKMMIGNIINDRQVQADVGEKCYDIVVANILADVLVPLTPVIVNQLAIGGVYITSGIIEEKEVEVKTAIIKAGLTVEEIAHQGEWVSITARKWE